MITLVKLYLRRDSTAAYGCLKVISEQRQPDSSHLC